VSLVADSAVHAAPEQTLLDQLTQSVFLKDRQGCFVAVNQAFCAGLSRPRADILGQDDFAFYPRGLAEKYRADDQQILREGVALEVEEQNLQGGQLRTVRVVKSPVRSPGGEIQGILCIFWDISEQRCLEAQLRQAQKMSAIAQLAGGIAHDFNNLLTGVLGNLSLAQLELSRAAWPEASAVAELLRHAEAASQRAAELTRQLLIFSRRVQPRPEPASLNDGVRQVLAGFTTRSTICLDTHLDPNLGLVLMDAAQLQQVARHLLGNAQEAMPDGGTLTVQTQNVTLVPEAAAHRPLPPGDQALILPVMHPDSRTGEFVRLRVSDTGAGISAEVLEHLFEPFFSTKGLGRGTGLGLAMAASIAKDHDGWLECHSAAGEGTRFDLYVPRLLAPAPARMAEPTTPTATILLIDDHEVVRSIGKNILEHQAYRVLVSGAGEPALDLIRREHKGIDLVLLDWVQSDLDGTVFLTGLRLVAPEIPMLLCAAYPTGPAVRAVEQCGAVGFVAKPFQPHELTRAVRIALEHRAAQPPRPRATRASTERAMSAQV